MDRGGRLRAGERPTERVGSARLAFALHLTAVAGFVDAVGAVTLWGVNLSFMSGNTTSLATAIANGATAQMLAFAAIIGAFVVGAFIGALSSLLVRRRGLLVVVPLVEAFLVAGSLKLFGTAPDVLAALPLSVAMGLQNVLRTEIVGVDIGGTFVTGMLYKLGENLALVLMRDVCGLEAMFAGACWLSLLTGGALGAASVVHGGLEVSLAIAIAALATLAAGQALASSLQDAAEPRRPSGG